MVLKDLFRINRDERWAAGLALVLLLPLQWLMLSKFWALFANYYEPLWRVFEHNYHMSGFDPTSLQVLHSWALRYDVVRHPLLAVLMLPLAGVEQLLEWASGSNCSMLVMSALLVFCAFYSFVFIYRTIRYGVGTQRWFALLLTAFAFSFAYILIATVVADHFCLSLFCLTMVLWLTAKKLRDGGRYSLVETLVLFVLTAGVTLSNGVVVFMAVLAVNGRDFFRPRFLLRAVVLPSVLMLGIAVGQTLLTGTRAVNESKGGEKAEWKVTDAVTDQFAWVSTKTQKWEVMQENFFGESLQMHRNHVLGDVLRGRPIIVKYNHRSQDYVVIALELLLLLGFFMGRRERLCWLLMGIFGFNFALHILLGFAMTEVYIMAAHWAFVLPVALAYTKQRQRLMIAASVVVLGLTLYLLIHHYILLYRYLTWPLNWA